MTGEGDTRRVKVRLDVTWVGIIGLGFQRSAHPNTETDQESKDYIVATPPRIRSLLKAVIGHSAQTEARVTNLASATELIQEISKGSATSVLREVKSALAELNTLENISLKERIRTTLYLDEKCQPYVLEVMGALLVRAADPMFMARALPLLVEVWQQLGASYRKWLDAVDANNLHSNEGQLAVCRLLGLQIRMAQCLLVRAKPIHAQIVTLSHKLYLHTERSPHGAHPIKLYPDAHGLVTAGSLLGVQHLMALAPFSTLPPGHILALIDWLWMHQEGITVTASPTDHTALVLDLATTDNCRPLRRGVQVPTARFIDCQRLLDDLYHNAPAFMNVSTPLYAQLLEAWSGQFRVFGRQSVRYQTEKEAIIRLGWTPLLALVNDPSTVIKDEITPKTTKSSDWKPLAPGEEESKPTKIERARVLNSSLTGLALALPKQLDSEPALGDLIGVALLDGAAVMLGQVVWINRSQTRYLGVGVKLLGEDAVVVTVQRVGTQRNTEGIALQRHSSSNGTDWTGLLLPPGNPLIAGEYLVAMNGEPELCRLVPMPTGSDRLVLAEALPA